jgi:hypothetical protein
MSQCFPISSCSSFEVSGITLRSLIHCELAVVQGERLGSSFSLLQVDIQFFEEATFSPTHVLNSFVKNQMVVAVALGLGLLVCSIGLYVCFCASMTLFLL